MGVNRKFIFECLHGSKLYGTDRPESDIDYKGVFIPSVQDLLSLQRCPEELKMDQKVSEGVKNDSRDTDRTFFSLQRFFKLALEGQPLAYEMLFAAPTIKEAEWDLVLNHRQLFLHKGGIKPFIGFAMAQAHKAVIKGENINKISEILDLCETISDQHSAVRNYQWPYLEAKENEFGYRVFSIAGRSFDIGMSVKDFKSALYILKNKYGSRAKNAAKDGYDYKSLSHAVRLIGQADEIITTGKLTFPRSDAEYIKAVRRGDVDRDWFEYLQGECDRLQKLSQETHVLRHEPDYQSVNELCKEMLLESITKCSITANPTSQ